ESPTCREHQRCPHADVDSLLIASTLLGTLAQPCAVAILPDLTWGPRAIARPRPLRNDENESRSKIHRHADAEVGGLPGRTGTRLCRAQFGARHGAAAPAHGRTSPA